MSAPCSVKASGAYFTLCPRFKITDCDLERWTPWASTSVEQRLDKMALKSELLDLKARVDGLQAQVRALEERLSA